jgi:hypothetical protein
VVPFIIEVVSRQGDSGSEYRGQTTEDRSGAAFFDFFISLPTSVLCHLFADTLRNEGLGKEDTGWIPFTGNEY